MNSFYRRMDEAGRIREEMNREIIKREERRIITGFLLQDKIEQKDAASIIRGIKTATFLAETGQQALVITNAEMAAGIRAEVDREAVEIIITNAVEPGTAYLVTNKKLKEQLLANIEHRGY